MGTQKNHLNETVLLSTQNICSNLWVRKKSKFYAIKMSLSGSMPLCLENVHLYHHFCAFVCQECDCSNHNFSVLSFVTSFAVDYLIKTSHIYHT